MSIYHPTFLPQHYACVVRRGTDQAWNMPDRQLATTELPLCHCNICTTPTTWSKSVGICITLLNNMVHTAHTLGNGGAQEAQRLHWAENERVKLGKQHTPFAYFPSDILEINILTLPLWLQLWSTSFRLIFAWGVSTHFLSMESQIEFHPGFQHLQFLLTLTNRDPAKQFKTLNSFQSINLSRI